MECLKDLLFELDALKEEDYPNPDKVTLPDITGKIKCYRNIVKLKDAPVGLVILVSSLDTDEPVIFFNSKEHLSSGDAVLTDIRTGIRVHYNKHILVITMSVTSSKTGTAMYHL